MSSKSQKKNVVRVNSKPAQPTIPRPSSTRSPTPRRTTGTQPASVQPDKPLEPKVESPSEPKVESASETKVESASKINVQEQVTDDKPFEININIADKDRTESTLSPKTSRNIKSIKNIKTVNNKSYEDLLYTCGYKLDGKIMCDGELIIMRATDMNCKPVYVMPDMKGYDTGIPCVEVQKCNNSIPFSIKQGMIRSTNMLLRGVVIISGCEIVILNRDNDINISEKSYSTEAEHKTTHMLLECYPMISLHELTINKDIINRAVKDTNIQLEEKQAHYIKKYLDEIILCSKNLNDNIIACAQKMIGAYNSYHPNVLKLSKINDWYNEQPNPNLIDEEDVEKCTKAKYNLTVRYNKLCNIRKCMTTLVDMLPCLRELDCEVKELTASSNLAVDSKILYEN